MSDWQERITRDTAPVIRVEHELRYRIAAPLVGRSDIWADLGCGNGLAAAAAFEGSLPKRAVLVDVAESAVSGAAAELGIAQTRGIVGDLTRPEDLDAIGEALLAVHGVRVVTCFEVVEHLDSFVALLEWAVSLARAGEAGFLLSVPNDAFWAIQNPHHRTSWGEGAFRELRALLPAEHALLRQVGLSGSALLDWEAERAGYDVTTQVGAEAVATHFIAAFGPGHDLVWKGALAVQDDLLGQRRWERQRENDAAVWQQTAHDQAAKIEQLQNELAERVVWFEQWRTYIHELERELRRPLSGVSPDELPDGSDLAARDSAGSKPSEAVDPSTAELDPQGDSAGSAIPPGTPPR